MSYFRKTEIAFDRRFLAAYRTLGPAASLLPDEFQTSGLIQSGDSQIVRSSSSSHDESGNYGQGHADDRRPLEAIVSNRNAPQKHVWRAKIILATADGSGTSEIMR